MERVYNKLVRDRIPEIIESKGEKPITRILDADEYKKELEIKLNEEYKEMLETSTSEDRIEELSDILEIVRALASLENKTLDDVIKVADEKSVKRGGFEQRIFLEKVDE